MNVEDADRRVANIESRTMEEEPVITVLPSVVVGLNPQAQLVDWPSGSAVLGFSHALTPAPTESEPAGESAGEPAL